MRKSNFLDNIDRFSDTYNELQAHLMGIFTSGVYFTNADFVNIAKGLGYELDYKSREYLIKTLFTDCEKDNKEAELLQALIAYIVKRINEYKALGDNYPNARNKISSMMNKAKNTQMLLYKMIQNISLKSQVEDDNR